MSNELWIAAASLKRTVQAAIEAGDWKVDGACDPTMDLERLANCLANPNRREWVGLTYEEIEKIYEEYGQCRKYGYEEAIEQALKEKNCG